MQFFVDVNGSNPLEVASEVDRYCSWPGQACGYKVGHSEINRQREKATTALGSKFDLQGLQRHRGPRRQRAARRAGEERRRIHPGHVDAGRAVRHVVLLRGVNVGGHRTFRPARLAEQLQHLGAVNIGAAGTFVIRKPVTQAQLRAELAERLPFDTDIMICPSREIARLLSQDWFAGRPSRPDIVRFVSVLSRVPRLAPRLPMTLPSGPKGPALRREVSGC